MKSTVRHYALWLTIAALLASSACGPQADQEAGAYRGRILPEPRVKPDFVLTDTEGQPFDFRAETDGQLTLLFFGYTHCPDICPVHMANIAAVLDRSSPELRRGTEVVFVTVDPERDTPERIRQWLDSFDPSFVGLRGDMERVNEIQTALGLPPAAKGEPEDNLAHLAYPFGTRQTDWAHDLPKLIDSEWTR